MNAINNKNNDIINDDGNYVDENTFGRTRTHTQ